MVSANTISQLIEMLARSQVSMMTVPNLAPKLSRSGAPCRQLTPRRGGMKFQINANRYSGAVARRWVGGNVSGVALNLDALLCVQPRDAQSFGGIGGKTFISSGEMRNRFPCATEVVWNATNQNPA